MAMTNELGGKRKNEEIKTSHIEGTDTIEQIRGLEEPESKKPSLEQEILKNVTKFPISSNIKGFLVSFDAGRNYCQILENVLQLLNEYADKVYRTDEKSCYFEHKLANDAGQSPIFIETDMDDPIVLIDAIFTDLQTPNFDVEKVKLWSSILPVHWTCDTQPEEIIQSIKNVLEPLFTEQGEKKLPRIMINYRRFKASDSDKDVIAKTILAYLASKRAEERPTEEGAAESYVHATVELRVLRKICCISFMERAKSKRYSVFNALKERKKVLEGKSISHQAENEKEPDTDKVDTTVKSNET